MARPRMFLVWLFFIFTVPSLAFAKRTLDRCAVVERSGEYVLQKDVSSPGTCFVIRADHVTLDLNGHSIVYGGSAQGDAPQYGIVAQACWDTSAKIRKGACGEPFDVLTVRNGTITQAPGAPAFSHAIRVGQGRSEGLTLERLQISVSSDSSVPIFVTSSAGKTNIHDVVLRSSVKSIQSRHQIQGVSIRMPEIASTTSPDSIRGIEIIGGPQGGVQSVTPGSVIENNTFHLDSSYSNDFAVFAWASGQIVRRNKIDGVGRGIQVAYGKGVQVTGNTVDLRENPVNLEYGGCQLAGSFGIQLENQSTQARVSQNRILVTAKDCDARAFRATGTGEDNKNRSSGNTYVASRLANTQAKAVSASFSNARDVTLEDDVLEADTHNAEIDADGATGIVLRRCRFVRGNNPAADYATLYLVPNTKEFTHLAAELTLIDPIFERGASPDSFKMVPVGFETWGGRAQYTVVRTTRVKVQDASGRAAANAEVAAEDPVGRSSVRARTDASGIAQIELAEFRRFNTRQGIERQEFAYHVTANVGGKKAGVDVQATANAEVTITLP